jgi:hypothetical protein
MARATMTTRRLLAVLLLALAVILTALPAAAQGPRAETPMLGGSGTPVLGGGGAPLGFGLDVSSLKSGLATTADRLSAVSFDLKLRWPLATSDEPGDLVRSLRPFVSLGPALLVAPPPIDIPPALDPRATADRGLGLGVRGGAGVSLQLGKSTELFGQYSVTRSTTDRSPVGGRSPVEGGLNAFDLLYGLSVRF